MKRTLVLMGLAMLTVAACGKSAEEKAAEDAAKAAEQLTKAAQQMGQAATQTAQQQVAQGMQQMAQGLQGIQGNVAVVDFEKLMPFLPDYAGWTRSEPKGQQVSMGFKVSEAEARYEKGDSSIRLQITDIALAQAMLAPFSIWMAAGYNERSSDGYKKAVTVSGHPGFEEWDKSSKHGQLTVVVGNRFIVKADADEVENTDPARKLIESIDLGKLAAVK